jgi:hypothetical protein
LLRSVQSPLLIIGTPDSRPHHCPNEDFIRGTQSGTSGRAQTWLGRPCRCQHFSTVRSTNSTPSRERNGAQTQSLRPSPSGDFIAVSKSACSLASLCAARTVASKMFVPPFSPMTLFPFRTASHLVFSYSTRVNKNRNGTSTDTSNSPHHLGIRISNATQISVWTSLS